MMTHVCITFCDANCATWACERNKMQVPGDLPEGMIVAWLDFSDECKLYEPLDKEAA